MNLSRQIFELSPLFEAVQLQKVFADGKTFVDCIPKADVDEILAAYEKEKQADGFDLKQFVLTHFELPKAFASDVKVAASVEQHIQQLWDVLTRQPDEAGGSLIPLPNAYVVPGGRFGEVYYWDSYFTMLGLHASGRYEMIENMVKNFAHLIHSVGFIPNGNRTYYLGRSQPPFFSLMVQLLASIKGKEVLMEFLPALEKEYAFWMNGKEQLNKRNIAVNHVVLMSNGSILNRYWDAFDTPRPESYREDAELAHDYPQPEILYRHLRAGAASGWDYSCRWFKEVNAFKTIHTTDIIPVDLNCLLYHLETTIAEAAVLNNDVAKANEYERRTAQRKQAIHSYCWNESLQFFTDYDFIVDEQKPIKTLAASSALFFNIATNEQADAVAVTLEKEFLKDGGLVTTLHTTGQQWDAPNGWAPLQWMSIVGLENYHHHSLAHTIAQRWIGLNKNVFARTGKLMEKYNVVDTHLEAGGGEYEGQDGFGWTNGVLLALMKKYE
ncbi:MAG: alpha,alpha-trehalase TreF [Chitinophagaceae bacterium]|nr:alpha,alpha-trehalase TreF [Chitinophagaceae bacterium]